MNGVIELLSTSCMFSYLIIIISINPTKQCRSLNKYQNTFVNYYRMIFKDLTVS